MKSKIIFFFILFFGMVNTNNAFAMCDLCKANQPKGLENITHGEGPEGNIDYIIMFSAIVIVGYTLIMSIKYLIRPEEKESDHIKNLVLDDEQ